MGDVVDLVASDDDGAPPPHPALRAASSLAARAAPPRAAVDLSSDSDGACVVRCRSPPARRRRRAAPPPAAARPSNESDGACVVDCHSSPPQHPPPVDGGAVSTPAAVDPSSESDDACVIDCCSSPPPVPPHPPPVRNHDAAPPRAAAATAGEAVIDICDDADDAVVASVPRRIPDLGLRAMALEKRPPPSPPSQPLAGGAAARAESPAKRPRVARGERDRRARAKELERERRAAERARVRADREREKLAKHRKEILKRFAQFESGSKDNAQHTVSILLAAELVAGRDGEDMHAKLNAVFPGQVILTSRDGLANVVRWQRRQPSGGVQPAGDVRDVPGDTLEYVALCFRAEEFCTHIQKDTLETLAVNVLEKLAGKRVEFVIEGVKQLCSATAEEVARGNSDAISNGQMILSEELVRDCCMSLYMEYGIVSNLVKNRTEVCDYLISLTHRIAYAPFRKPLSHVDMNSNFLSSDVGGCVTVEDGGGEIRLETADDCGMVYLKFLCVIPGVSLEKAKCIRRQFPTLRKLFDAYAACNSQQERDSLLADVRYTVSGRRLGPALSKLIATVFNSRDGGTMVHIGSLHALPETPQGLPLGSQELC